MIFVVGNPRSGTTMMGRILGNHPFVYTFRELHFFEKLWSTKDTSFRFLRTEAVDLAARMISIQKDGFFYQKDPKLFAEQAELIIQNYKEGVSTPVSIYQVFLEYITISKGKSISCEQTPGYVYYIEEILNHFPQCKIVNMIRDPRDVLLSQKKRWKRIFTYKKSLKQTLRIWMNYHPFSTSRLWNAAVGKTGNFIDDKRLYTVRFEDVLENPEKEIEKICEFIGISYDKSMLEVPMVGSSFIEDMPEKKGINRERASSWNGGGLNSAEIYICQKIAADNMRKFGYKTEKVFPNPFLLIFYIFTFPLKLVFAFVMHKPGVRNINEAIKRRLNA